MGLLDTIKTLLGLDSREERRGESDVGVTVERDTHDADEPRTASESAVKAPADEATEESDAVAAGTDAAASTGSMVDDDPDTAAEPAEAVAVGDDADESVDTEPPETDDAAAAGSEAAASTGSMVDENVDDEAAEPAEAVAVGDDTEATTEDDEDADEPSAEDEADAVEETAESGATDSPDVLKGIGPAYAQRLADAGIETVGELAAADADEVAAAIDVSPKRVGRWIDRAKEY